MEWLLANWFWVLVFVLFIAIHMFGHGGHGGHGRHKGHGDGGCHLDKPKKQEADRSDHKHPEEHQH